MNATLSPRAAVLTLLAISTTFGANHVAARVAFDHGASVATAVFARSGVTALVLLVLLRVWGVSMTLPRMTLAKSLFVGLLVCTQSFCIFSAVARMPVALALLAFNSFPILLTLLVWLLDGQKPTPRQLGAMVMAVVGLAFALDVAGGAAGFSGRWQEIGVGVMFGLGAAISFAFVFYLNSRWLKEVDGRLRTFHAMSVTAPAMLALVFTGSTFALPADGTGWFALVLLTACYGTAITMLFIVQPWPGMSRYTTALNFEPIAILIMAWAFLGQTVKPLQIFGALMVVGAVVLLGSKK